MTTHIRVTGLCAGNSPVTGEFPAQMASNAENVTKVTAVIFWPIYGWIGQPDLFVPHFFVAGPRVSEPVTNGDIRKQIVF